MGAEPKPFRKLPTSQTQTTNMKKRQFLTLTGAALLGALFSSNVKSANAAIDVVASTPELAAITKAVGGSDVSVYSIARPNQDYHTIEPRPSDVARIARARMVVRSGLSLDMWMDSLMNAAGNGRLNRGGSGYVDASAGIPTLDKPQGSITGASGDVHPQGNPHFLYDPIYAKFAARNIAKGLIAVDAANAADYRAGLGAFYKQIDARMVGWNAQLAPYRGKALVTYHSNYNYFLRRFGIRQYGTLEPVPGIPPSAKHLSQLAAQMKRDKVSGILIEQIYPARYADLLKRQVGSNYAVGPYSVTTQDAGGYFNLINTLVAKTKAALS